MGERLVISDHHADLSGMGRSGLAVVILQFGVPTAQQRELNSVVENQGKIFEQEIKTLLPGQAADDADQERIRYLRKTHSLLQRRLVGRAAGRAIRMVEPGDMRIGCRIPDRDVDTVENAAEIAGAAAQQ